MSGEYGLSEWSHRTSTGLWGASRTAHTADDMKCHMETRSYMQRLLKNVSPLCPGSVCHLALHGMEKESKSNFIL